MKLIIFVLVCYQFLSFRCEPSSNENDIDCFKRKNGDLFKLFRDHNNFETKAKPPKGLTFTREQRCWNHNDILNISTPMRLLQARVQYMKDKSHNMRNMTSIFRYNKPMLKNLLLLIKESIHIVPVQDHIAEMYDYIYHGKMNKTDAYLNQHSSELWIPFILRHHKHGNKLLHPSSSSYEESHTLFNPTSIGSNNSSFPPLFHYIDAHVFTFGLYVGNEDRILINNIQFYWLKLLKQLLSHPLWRSANGMDVLIPASHPMTPLNINDEVSRLHLLAQASFLVTDHDMKSRYGKDIIIPYFSSGDISSVKNQTIIKDIFIYFAAKPNQHLRKHLLYTLDFLYKMIQQHDDDKKNSKILDEDRLLLHNVIIRDKIASIDEYHDYLHRSVFCLMVRGDTTSSSRFFTAIQAGCIPVIISDWIILPYQQIIDYTSFTIQIEESIILHDPLHMIRYLRSISKDTIHHLQQGLIYAREVLSYDSPHELNPVSLMLIDGMIHRIQYCMNIFSKRYMDDMKRTMLSSGIESNCHRLQYRVNKLLGVSLDQLHMQLASFHCRRKRQGQAYSICDIHHQ